MFRAETGETLSGQRSRAVKVVGASSLTLTFLCDFSLSSESQFPHLPISGWSLFPPTHPKFTAQVLWIQVTISFLLMTELAAEVLQLGQGPPTTTLTALREVLILQPLSMCIVLDP